jgi:hypothetical protein
MLLIRIPPNHSMCRARSFCALPLASMVTCATWGVISSPSQDLADAAMQAVRQWTDKPYLLNGEVVEVMTMVNVAFSLKP